MLALEKGFHYMILSFDGTKSHYVGKQNICGLPCLEGKKNGWVHFRGAAKKQESENVTEIDFAVYRGGNYFVEWNPKLNSDEMNVLINWQSRADMRLMENVSLSTYNFHCLEPYADFHSWQTVPHAVQVVDN